MEEAPRGNRAGDLWAELSSMQVHLEEERLSRGIPCPGVPPAVPSPDPRGVALGGAGQWRWEAGTKPETTTTLSVCPSSLWTCFSAIFFFFFFCHILLTGHLGRVGDGGAPASNNQQGWGLGQGWGAGVCSQPSGSEST